jgi:hypothetical protein
MTDQRRRAWRLNALLLIALPAGAATLSYTGLTETGAYSPGTQSFDGETDPAHSNDILGITRNIFGPDALHVAFLSGEVDFGRIASAATVNAGPVAPGPKGFFSSLSLSFGDTLTIQGASSGFLSLDLSLHGILAQSGGAADSAQGNLSIFTADLSGNTTSSATLCTYWQGASAPGYCAPGLIGALAPLMAAMTITPDGLGGAIYQGHPAPVHYQ